eukprot:symbB.v1.2.001890.t1/scaffold101.1/size361152/4
MSATANVVLTSFARQRWSLVLDLHSWLPQQAVTLDQIGHSALLQAEGLSRSWPRLMERLDQMSSRSLVPNCISLNVAMTGSQGGTGWRKALMMERMGASQRIHLDMVFYNGVIGAWAQGLHWPLVLECLKGVQPDAAGLSTSTKCFKETSQWRQALALGRGPHLGTLSSLTSACASAQRWRNALQVSSFPGVSMDGQLLGALIYACQEGSQWSLALAARCQDHLVVPSAVGLNACILACGVGGAWKFAMTFWDSMEGDEFTPTAVIEACGRASQSQVALDLLKNGGEISELTFNAALAACDRAEQAAAKKNGLDIVVNIAQWRQALSRPPTGELFFACAHFPEPWQRYRKEVTVESEDGSQGAVDDLEEADEDEEEGEEKEENGKVQTMSFPTRQKDMNYDGLTSFEQLMLLKVIQPESVIRAVQGFIAEVLDESLLVMQPISILQAMEDLQEKEGKFRALLLRCDSLSSQCPSIYDELKVLVEQRKATKEGRRAQLVRCSPLQSIEQVKEAAHEGATVLITELQLAGQEFLAELELLMEELCLPATGQGNITVDAHHSSTQHVGTHHTRECFRLVLSFDGDLPPMSIMQMCQKVAVFPPVGVRGRLRQLTGTVSFERSGEMEGESLLPWSRTLFSLCLFHSVLAVRYQRYQCCFQSTAYDIAANWSFKSAVHFLEQETSSQELMQHPPWEAITHWIRTVTHGGHLGDCWHRQQIYALIERFLGPAAEALKRDCAEGLEAEDMSELELQRARNLCQYLDFQLNDHTPPGKEAWRYLDQLPEAPAELFGLHPREDRVFDSHSSIAMLATLAQIRPPSEDVAAAAAVELKQHLKVEEMLNELPKSSEKLKQELLKPSKARSRRSLERSEQQDPFHGDPPIAQVLRQELWSLLELVAFLRADLQQIRDMLVSKLELSPEMHEVLRNIFNNTVPTRWRQRAFLSCRPLQGWFIGLKIRLQWLHAAWSERGHEPLCHRLDFYWRPRQLLLSYLRVAAQKDNVALEAYSFRHKVVDRMEEEEDVQDRPAVGLYCVGLYLYGAQWDRKRAILAPR